MVVTRVQEHTYDLTVTWTGNTGAGTSGYRAYSRNHEIAVHGCPNLPGSSDAAFLGDSARYNPELLLLASLSSCHMLWYLHLCSVNGIVVQAYEDCASGTMAEDAAGSGRFTSAVLAPEVTVGPGADRVLALRLHDEAHDKCFIANSVNFPVSHEPVLRTGG